MKRTMRFLALLYPSDWRARYGDELEGLLEETRPCMRDAFDILWGALKMQMTTWSFGRIMLACVAAGILAATTISFALPVHYQSQVTLTVTPASSAGNLLVSDLAKIVLSPESLASIIRENNLYPRERATMSLDDVISKTRGKIRVTALPADLPSNRDALTFIIQFDYPDARVAQQVDSALISSFMESVVETARLQRSRFTYRVQDPPNLPQRPAGPNRTRFAALGLFAGILMGLALAIAARTPRTTTVRNG
jgi:capsular polysaccharide biosynthesis protein